jgi:hypothetical protein
LEAQEKAEFGAFVGIEFEHVFSIESDFAFGDFVFWMTHEDIAERAFSGAVRAHDGVNFTGFDRERNAFEDFFVFDFGVEIFDDEHGSVMKMI